MKKLFVLLLLLSVLFLSSCMYLDTGTKSNARLKQLLEAIDAEERDALKSLFSKVALDEVGDFDGDMDYLFAFFQGDVESWTRDSWTSGESTRYGKITEQSVSWYTVTTDKDIYMFFMIDYPIDTINPHNAGLFSLRVIKAVDEETQFTYWQDMQIAGIYQPK